MKKTIEVTTTTTNEVEVQLPYYSAVNRIFYKVYGNNDWDCICVSYPSEVACKIHNTLAEHAFKYGAIECTKEEFDFAFKTAIDYLNVLNY